jgi:hypothetical protein
LSTNAIEDKPIILVYGQIEMIEELQKLKQKTSNKSDKFFSFSLEKKLTL